MSSKRLRKGLVILIVIGMLFAMGAASLSTAQAVPGSEDTAFSSASEKIEVLIGFHEKPNRGLVEAFGGEVYREFTIVDVIAARMTPQAAEAISNNRAVRYVELDGPVYALETAVASETETVPWGIDRVFGDEEYSFETWDKSTGVGIGVAVLDTGIDGNHEDLNVVGGYNALIEEEKDYKDYHGHGTHVAGTVAALDDGVEADPKEVDYVVGVAPAVDLFAVKVLDDDGAGKVSDIVDGIQWANENDIPIMNMSLGSRHHNQSLQDACDNAYLDGHILVAAAGNSGNRGGGGDNVVYPAGYDSVIAVAASNEDDNRANFSSTGPAVELIAPGVDVWSTWTNDKDYHEGSGTSMASPHVAGVAALAWAANEELPNVDIRGILQDTAEDLGMEENHQGYGLVRADRVVAEIEPAAFGSIEGTVSDDDGATIEGATVKVEETELSAETDEHGNYLIEDVPEGNYDVTASAEGYYSATEENVDVVEDSAVTVDFNLEPKPEYTLTVDVSPDGSGTVKVDGEEADLPYEEVYYEDTEVTLEAVAGEGYEFSYWNVDGENYTEEAETTLTMDKDKDAVAYFEEVEYVTLTMKAPDGEGTVEPESGDHEYPEDTEVELAATPEEGWKFSEWIGDVEDSGSAETTVTMDDDKVVQAVFEEIEEGIVSVESIDYETEGGRFGDRHLIVKVALVDGEGEAVSNAEVWIELYLDNDLYASDSGTTGEDGIVTFKFNNAPSGTYTTEVADVEAENLQWDGETPDNKYEK